MTTKRTAEKYWSIDGVTYDLESFAQHHPGGASFIHRTRGQDISTLFHTRHRQPSRLRPLLSRYAVQTETVDGQQGFRDDTGFLKELHERLAEHNWQEAVILSNLAFALLLLTLVVFGVYLHWRAVGGDVKVIPYAVWMAVTRICLAASGRSFAFQKASLLNVTLSRLVEVDYRGEAKTAVDTVCSKTQHVSRLKRLPRGFRIPMDTCLGFLSVVISCWTPLRCFHRFFKHPSVDTFYQFFGCLLIRVLLVIEIWQFIAAQKVSFWMTQFLLTRVLSLMLAICVPIDQASPEDDWPRGIIHSTVDVTLTKNPYVDCLLTSGLSCERIHRLLPFQWSPFAHVAVTALAEDIAQKKQIDWKPPVHLITHRLHSAIDTYFLQPGNVTSPPVSLRDEHFSQEALRSLWAVVWWHLFGEDSAVQKHMKTD